MRFIHNFSLRSVASASDLKYSIGILKLTTNEDNYQNAEKIGEVVADYSNDV